MKFGLTSSFSCSYLPGREERLMVYVPDTLDDTSQAYDKLIQAGFRRSGEQVYRPHCARCDECKAVRVDVNAFTPNRKQQRVSRKNQDLRLLWRAFDDVNIHDYFAIYANYISERHRDGSMYPPDLGNFISFNRCAWREPYFLEAWLEDELVAVAITDKTTTGLSAFYTFYAPEQHKRSLGFYLISAQIEQARLLGLPYLYLGYYIKDCAKMNYKTQLNACEIFNGEFWQPVVPTQAVTG
jgi:arginine-tRNA-protein transferase